jgi:glutamate carboxypeptidase
MLEFLQQIVQIESPSTHKAGNDALGSHIVERLKLSGFKAERYPQEEFGDHWVCRLGEESREQILVLCHMDTVWQVGEIAKRPFRVESGKAFGPGAFDMKGGIAQTVFAVEALLRSGRRLHKRVAILLNSDEESGSPTSREIIEEEARKSSVVLVAEPATGLNGAVKTFRKAGGYFHLEVTGVPAHAAANHEKGRSAIRELAHQILYLESLTDYDEGTTVNVGMAGGGDVSICTVPERAYAKIDLRVAKAELVEPMVQKILNLRPATEGTSLKVSGSMHRPLMARTPDIVRLYQIAKRFMSETGLDLEEAGTGGASDGNFTAALGIPTLDGLGSVGDGAHALSEYLLVDKMAERAALMAKLLESL